MRLVPPRFATWLRDDISPVSVCFSKSCSSARSRRGCVKAVAITTPGTQSVKFSLSTATGLFSGSFAVPGESGVRIFRGAMLQPDIRGAGFFRGYTKSGGVYFDQQILGGSVGGVIITH